jgi:putative flippase GtrA
LQTTEKSLFRGASDRIGVQLFRYTLVGGLAFAVDFGTLFLLTHFFGLHYLASATGAFALGLAINYAISIVWVFDQRAVKNQSAEFAIFAALGIFGLGVNDLAMYVLTGWLGLHYLVSKIVATVATYAWNFCSRKLLLFSTGNGASGANEAIPVTSGVREVVF